MNAILKFVDGSDSFKILIKLYLLIICNANTMHNTIKNIIISFVHLIFNLIRYLVFRCYFIWYWWIRSAFIIWWKMWVLIISCCSSRVFYASQLLNPPLIIYLSLKIIHYFKYLVSMLRKRNGAFVNDTNITTEDKDIVLSVSWNIVFTESLLTYTYLFYVIL